jgi:small subunit ribosomal protein S9
MTEDKKNSEKYIYATGRRKTSVARVRIYEEAKGKNIIIINDKDCRNYFEGNNVLVEKVYSPLKLLNLENKFKISIKVSGGGVNGQAEAIRLGIARALLNINNDFKKILKAHGYLTRDPRKVERKKPGFKKARRAPQWKKR